MMTSHYISIPFLGFSSNQRQKSDKVYEHIDNREVHTGDLVRGFELVKMQNEWHIRKRSAS